MASQVRFCSGVFLLWQLHGVFLTLFTLFVYLCSDFLPGFTLLSHWPKQLYSSTNKMNTYTEGHPTSEKNKGGKPFSHHHMFVKVEGIPPKAVHVHFLIQLPLATHASTRSCCKMLNQLCAYLSPQLSLISHSL